MAAIDLGPMLTAVSGLALIAVPLLAVAASLVVLYLNVKGVRVVVNAIHGRIVTERQEQEFRQRYAREEKRRAYRQWKAAQVGPRRRRRW